MATFYESHINGKSAEEILKALSDLATGTDADVLLLAAQMKKAQEQINNQRQCTSDLTTSIGTLVDSVKRASGDSGALAKKIVWLIVAVVAVGAGQIIAAAWPYLAWWWHH